MHDGGAGGGGHIGGGHVPGGHIPGGHIPAGGHTPAHHPRDGLTVGYDHSASQAADPLAASAGGISRRGQSKVAALSVIAVIVIIFIVFLVI